jgi:hypothetical protein
MAIMFSSFESTLLVLAWLLDTMEDIFAKKMVNSFFYVGVCLWGACFRKESDKSL